jgi:hypothetical protein
VRVQNGPLRVQGRKGLRKIVKSAVVRHDLASVLVVLVVISSNSIGLPSVPYFDSHVANSSDCCRAIIILTSAAQDSSRNLQAILGLLQEDGRSNFCRKRRVFQVKGSQGISRGAALDWAYYLAVAYVEETEE